MLLLKAQFQGLRIIGHMVKFQPLALLIDIDAILLRLDLYFYTMYPHIYSKNMSDIKFFHLVFWPSKIENCDLTTKTEIMIIGLTNSCEMI